MLRVREKAAFLLALLFFLFQLITSIASPIVTFSPFLILLFRSLALIRILWIAIGCGLLVDLFSSTPFGLSTCVYTIDCFLLYHQRNFLYEDRPLSFFLFNTLFSILFSSLTLLILVLLEEGFPVSLSFVGADLILYPFLDGGYALLWFSLPLYWLEKIRFLRRG